MGKYIKKRDDWFVDIDYNGSSCTLSVCQVSITLWSLRTEKDCRRKGYATKVLEYAKRVADKYKLPLRLRVSPFADKPMEFNDLVKFYSKMGFVDVGHRMVYTPKGN